MKLPAVGELLDERFMEHRRRSTSVAGITCALAAVLLFAWRYFVHDQWSWDLLVVAAVFLLVKYAVLAWHRFHN
jgi:drug/metabolite transporter (DMT)-like permease